MLEENLGCTNTQTCQRTVSQHAPQSRAGALPADGAPAQSDLAFHRKKHDLPTPDCVLRHNRLVTDTRITASVLSIRWDRVRANSILKATARRQSNTKVPLTCDYSPVVTLIQRASRCVVGHFVLLQMGGSSGRVAAHVKGETCTANTLNAALLNYHTNRY